jgi:hypothetical protein
LRRDTVIWSLSKGLPLIMTVGGFFPEFDYSGNHLQTIADETKTYEVISFNILAAEGHYLGEGSSKVF